MSVLMKFVLIRRWFHRIDIAVWEDAVYCCGDDNRAYEILSRLASGWCHLQRIRPGIQRLQRARRRQMGPHFQRWYLEVWGNCFLAIVVPVGWAGRMGAFILQQLPKFCLLVSWWNRGNKEPEAAGATAGATAGELCARSCSLGMKDN